MITPLSVEKEKVPAYNKPAHDDFGLSSESRGRDVIRLTRMHSALLVDHPHFIPTIARWYFDDSGYKIPGNSFEGTCERIRGKLNRDTPPLHVIALIENRLVGVAQWKRYEMPEYPTNEHWLGSLYVPPDERYNGVGRFLANEVASIAKRNRVSRLYLCTEHLSGGLYAEAGWVPFDRTVSRGDEVLVMVKDLDV